MNEAARKKAESSGVKSFSIYGRRGHATDKQRQYEFVSVSMLRLTDGHLVGRSFMKCWDRERGGGEKFGDLICRFTRLPWPHVSRRSQLHTQPAGGSFNVRRVLRINSEQM